MEPNDKLLRFWWWLQILYLRLSFQFLFLEEYFKKCWNSIKNEKQEERNPIDEEKKRIAFHDFVTYVDKIITEAEVIKKQGLKEYRKWSVARENTIQKVAAISERMKEVNDNTNAAQTLCKGISMGAKFAIFGGPVATMIGAGTSLLFDICYAACSKAKIEELEKMCAVVQRTLKKDTQETEQLLCLMDRPRLISNDIKNCIKKFHSASLKGFYDSVPSLRRFARVIKAIDVDNPKGIAKFLMALRMETEYLANDPSFNILTSLSGLIRYNPGVVELTAVCPGIVYNAGVLLSSFSGVGAGVSGASVSFGGILKRSLNGLAILSDFGDIVKKVSEFNEYPELCKELNEITYKLEREMVRITDIARNLYHF